MTHPWSKQHHIVHDPTEMWFELEKELMSSMKLGEKKVQSRRKKGEPKSHTEI